MLFRDFKGNREIKNLLSKMLSEGRFPHAIILQGEDGLGKHMLAELLASALVCKSSAEVPCGECSGCIKAKAGSHPDIHRAQGSGAMRSFHVDEIRYIRSDIYKKPNESQHRVYLLFGAHTMSPQAQNALLKVLEEPPEYAVFILTCTAASALLPTVCSRAQIITLSPPSEDEAVEAALKKCDKVTEHEMREAAKKYGCNIGKMIASFEDESHEAAKKLAVSIAQAACSPQEFPLLEITAPMLKDRALIKEVMGFISLIFRDACALRLGSGILLSGDALSKEAAELLSKRLTRDRLFKLPYLSKEVLENVDKNANTTLLVTEFCTRLRYLTGK